MLHRATKTLFKLTQEIPFQKKSTRKSATKENISFVLHRLTLLFQTNNSKPLTKQQNPPPRIFFFLQLTIHIKKTERERERDHIKKKSIHIEHDQK